MLQLAGRLAKGALTDRSIDLLWSMASRGDIIPDDIMAETLQQIVNILKQQDHQDKLNDKNQIKANTKRKANLMRKLLLQLQAEPQGQSSIPIMQLFEYIGNLFDDKLLDNNRLDALHADHSNYDDSAEDITGMDHFCLAPFLDLIFFCV